MAPSFVDIITPMLLSEFASEYWDKKGLHLSENSCRFESLALTCNQIVASAAQARRVRAVYTDASHSRVILAREIASVDIESYRSTGATVCITGIESGCPAMSALASDAKRVIGHLGGVDCRAYMSAHGSGFPIHFDARGVFTMQIGGRKTWRYSELPLVRHPLFNGTIRNGELMYQVDGGPQMSPSSCLESPLTHNIQAVVSSMKEVTLAPGDILYLPAGALHEAQADGESLAVTIAFNYIDLGSPIDVDSLARSDVIRRSHKWRQCPPSNAFPTHVD